MAWRNASSKALSNLFILLVLLSGSAWPDPSDRVLSTHGLKRGLTLYQVEKSAPGSLGAVVEWRGMATAVQGDSFVLQVGPYRITVHGLHAGFRPTNGQSIRVTGKLLAIGTAPVLEALVVAPMKVHTSKGIGWNPDVVTQQEIQELGQWYQWILEFNPHLSPQTAGNYAAAIFHYSRPYRLDPRLVLSIVAAESAFEKDAVSKVGAIGLGQLMPDTAVRLGVLDIHDPNQNLQGCIKYLSEQMRRWQYSDHAMQRVIASYNAGEGAVEQYNGIPPYAETQAYVTYVLSLYHELGGL
ncbi:MAG TPA: lytic transglycosylase domain-containing protein [Candidatus Xenobia bacterium]|jgi:hypothetical protein